MHELTLWSSHAFSLYVAESWEVKQDILDEMPHFNTLSGQLHIKDLI